MVLASGAAQASPQQTSTATDAAHSSVMTEPATAQASVPRLVQFNGILKDTAGRPVVGVASVTFAIYAEQDGGTALWSETQNVIADANGHFSALLGGATASGMPAELFGNGQSRWLGITVARSAEMPRVLLASVPYALKAQDAETLGGLPASAYVTTQALAASNARATLPVVGGNTTIIATPQVATQAAIPQATPSGTGTTDYIPIWTSSSAIGNSTIFESAGLVGIGTNRPAGTLDVNGNSIFRGSFQLPPGHPATASSGYESHSFQFQASSYNSTTAVSDTEAFGFRAEPLNNNTASPSAKLDLFYGPGGGTLTDTGLSFAANGIVTFAPGQIFTGSSVVSPQVNFSGNGTTTLGLLQLGGTTLLNTYGSTTNLYFGVEAGGGFASTSVGYNTGLGYHALFSVTSGGYNVALGGQTLEHLTTGSDVTAIGMNAGLLLTDGSDDTAVGAGAFANAVSGVINNTAVGSLAMGSSTSGSNNTAVGYIAGQNTNGDDNTLIGVGADTSGGVSLSTAIGYGAKVSASNALVLGGTGQFAVNVGVGTAAPISELEISGQSGSSFTAPAPVLTVTGTTGGVVALDFNTAGISTTGTYNPSVRMAVLSEASGNVLAFYANTPGGGLNNGLQQTFAVDAAGNAAVTGNLSKGGGSFKIDDPIDPANKYLSHSFVESPDMMNIYNGIVTLDAHGAAVVEMPEWFQALNRDFRYQLCAIGTPGPKLYVAAEIADNHFKIAGGKKGQRVSWQVTGIRQDAWANAHRIPNEEVKPAGEQGHYLHPELFGAGPDKAISAAKVAAPAGSAESANPTVPGSK
jgi:hypothetical protein